MKQPTLFEILKTALYIGAVGYGGPAILALMKRVIVHEKEWISDEEFMNALSLSQILPGATGVTLLGYIGQKLKGCWGGILMPFAFVFPAMAAITVLAWAYFAFGDLKFVHSIFMGLGAMVVALLVNATMMMGRSVFQGMDRNAFKGHRDCGAFISGDPLSALECGLYHPHLRGAARSGAASLCRRTAATGGITSPWKPCLATPDKEEGAESNCFRFTLPQALQVGDSLAEATNTSLIAPQSTHKNSKIGMTFFTSSLIALIVGCTHPAPSGTFLRPAGCNGSFGRGYLPRDGKRHHR